MCYSGGRSGWKGNARRKKGWIKEGREGEGTKMLARSSGEWKATKARGGVGNEMLCFFHLWREIQTFGSISAGSSGLYTCYATHMGWGHTHHVIFLTCLSTLELESPLPQSNLSLCDLLGWLVASRAREREGESDVSVVLGRGKSSKERGEVACDRGHCSCVVFV